VAVAVELVAACERLGWRMGTRSRVLHNCNNNFSSSSYNNSSNRGNNSRNNNGKAVVPVLLKVRQLQRSMTTSPNDGDARWRGTVRGMTFIILAGNSGVLVFKVYAPPASFLSHFLALSYASQASFISLSLSPLRLFLWIALYISMSFICIVWPRCILCSSFPSSRVCRFVSSNRVVCCLILPSFCLCLSL
jgi:hypothetical protein